MAADPLGWPAFDAPLLQAVVAAFLSRRKAIRYHGPLSCEREFNETEDRTYERLNLDYEGQGKLRLSVWEDGAVWVRACIAGAGSHGGWSFLDSFHGQPHRLAPADLVEKFEATILLCGGGEVPDRSERLRRLWRAVDPD
ncbi:MAG: hypothetical protein L0Z62_13505 [Gemmataceae bacterium]|nr:hypothetical protein [Gemmataceae bacterium]